MQIVHTIDSTCHMNANSAQNERAKFGYSSYFDVTTLIEQVYHYREKPNYHGLSL